MQKGSRGKGPPSCVTDLDAEAAEAVAKLIASSGARRRGAVRCDVRRRGRRVNGIVHTDSARAEPGEDDLAGHRAGQVLDVRGEVRDVVKTMFCSSCRTPPG